MYTCELCNYATESLRSFTFHFNFHRNVANFHFPCGVPGCTRTFKTYTNFRSHIYRDHKTFHKQVTVAKFKNVEAVLTCHVTSCSKKCRDLIEFLAHLRGHIEDQVSVLCPFKNCERTYHNKKSFSSHLSRNHKTWSVSLLSDAVCAVDPSSQATASESDHSESLVPQDTGLDHDFVDDEDVDDDQELLTSVDQDQYLNSLALFYLKLQAKFLLPSSVIQNIIEEFQKIHQIGQGHLLSKLQEKLTALGVADTDVSQLVSDLSREDFLVACNTGPLRSDQTRKTFFQTRFSFVAPVEIYLGVDENGKQRHFQYVPIEETLVALFKHESVRSQYEQTHSVVTKEGIYEDISDGTTFLSNDLWRTHPSSLRIILYQDAFEVVNPLGSGKRKHKVLAVYLSLADLQPHHRSNIDHMQLVLLCREQDLKLFGQKAVFGQLIEDLKGLEDKGILVENGLNLRGALCAITGDNLGSHCIGGFKENFSTTKYCCRYCLKERDSFQNTPHLPGPSRTVQNYDCTVQKLTQDPETESFGIKFASLFNELKYFHVCAPGLPPCLGHDLFEGVLSRDLALFIKHFVKVKKYFTYVQLNRIIVQYKFLASDADNKPCEVNISGEKLGGHAVQNWCFGRLLPLLIGHRIKDPLNDSVWGLCLQLREIVELVCSPHISADQIAHLKYIIEEYLQERSALFPDQPLIPKHHYLAHYPDLIVKFGPLIRLWTLRFEAKHTYFKQCARKLHNFKNLCSTLAVKHQLLQAYFSAGCLFPPCVQVDKGIEFHASSYNDSIKSVTEEFQFTPENTVAAYKIVFKGTEYKKGLFVVLDRNDDGLVFGRIELLLAHCGSQIYFVVKKCQSLPLVELGVHSLIPEFSGKQDMVCVEAIKLLDYYPLPQYSIYNLSVISLHHAVA